MKSWRWVLLPNGLCPLSNWKRMLLFIYKEQLQKVIDFFLHTLLFSNSINCHGVCDTVFCSSFLIILNYFSMRNLHISTIFPWINKFKFVVNLKLQWNNLENYSFPKTYFKQFKRQIWKQFSELCVTKKIFPEFS